MTSRERHATIAPQSALVAEEGRLTEECRQAVVTAAVLRGAQQVTVLLVIADTDTADMYTVGLGLEGFRVLAVDPIGAAGMAARAAAHEHGPLVLVADADALAERNLAATIRQIRAARSMPVVVLAPNADGAAQARQRLDSTAAFLLKPCLPTMLSAVIRQLVPGWPALRSR